MLPQAFTTGIMKREKKTSITRVPKQNWINQDLSKQNQKSISEYILIPLE